MEPVTRAPVKTGHVVTKPLTSSPPSLGGHMTNQLLREGHVMRNIVRTMVVNMETVLGDLRGIMGEIQSLVTDIDTVTDKVDRKYQEGDRLKPVEHVVKKPHCVNLMRRSSSPDLSTNSSSKSMIIHSLGTKKRDEYAKVLKKRKPIKALPTNSTDISQTRNVKIRAVKSTVKNGCRQDAHGYSSYPRKTTNLPLQEHKAPEHMLNVSTETTKHKEKSQRFTTSENTQPVQSASQTAGTDKDWTGRSKRFKLHPRHGAGSHVKHRHEDSRKSWPNDIPLPFNHLKKKERKVISPSDEFALRVALPALKSPTQRRDRHNRERKKQLPVTSNNVAISESTHQVLKPDTQKSPQKSPDNSIFYDRVYEEIPTYPRIKRCSSVVVNKSFQPKTPTDQTSPITHLGMTKNVHIVKKPNVDSSSQEDFSLSYRPKATRLPASLQRSNARSDSPKLKSPTEKPEFDPDSKWTPVGKLSISPIKHESNEQYQSLESDLDSESATGEINDARSITPDMDWSYLGLIGNPNQPSATDDGYEIPILTEFINVKSSIPKRKSPQSDCQDVGLSGTISKSPSTSQSQRTPTFQTSIESIVEKMCKSPVVNHVFCKEVTRMDKDGYCGCYEAIVDSVLENIAGCESTESATYEFDDAMSETYISFDVDFEDDDWNAGLGHADENGLSPNEICFQNFSFGDFYEEDLFLITDSVLAIDQENNYREESQTEDFMNVSDARNNAFEKPCKRTLSVRSGESTKNDTGILLENVRTGLQQFSFKEKNKREVKQTVSPDQANLNVWPQNVALATSFHDQSSEMSSSFSSDEVSIPQRDSDCSVMSLSSPDFTACSPDTDVFVTSSDADDVFKSREDSPIQFSSHRQKMMKLRRDFFDSVLHTSDVTEGKQCTLSTTSEMGSVKLTEESLSIDNGLDNVSESGSYNEDKSNYNRNVNTWTAYALVNMQPDDISDTNSDILNDNSVNCSLTGSYLDIDNIGIVTQANQSLGY